MRTFRDTWCEETDAPANHTGPGVATYDPILNATSDPVLRRALRGRSRRRLASRLDVTLKR
jgi:hypothetical protein